MRFLQELMEMGAYEYEELMKDETEKDYEDENHARDHASEFIARAKKVLKYNKKPGESGDVNSLAKQFAKDYYDSIVEEIDKFKYGSDSMKKGGKEDDMDYYEDEGMDDYEGRM